MLWASHALFWCPYRAWAILHTVHSLGLASNSASTTSYENNANSNIISSSTAASFETQLIRTERQMQQAGGEDMSSGSSPVPAPEPDLWFVAFARTLLYVHAALAPALAAEHSPALRRCLQAELKCVCRWLMRAVQTFNSRCFEQRHGRE